MSWLEALGVFRTPPDSRTEAELAAEIRAEIDHHLDCAARARIEEGFEPAAAQAEALERFGDVAEVERACLWIRTGERNVLQRIHLAVTLFLLAGVLVLAWRGHAAERAALRAATVAEMMHQEALARRVEVERLRAGTEPVEHIVIGVGDRLRIIDEYNDHMDLTETVATDGKVLVPDVGWVHVEGLTREDAEKKLTEALAPYFVETLVRVKVTSAGAEATPVQFESF